MSEEKLIKQLEEKELNRLLIELKDIDNFKEFENGTFKYSLSKYQANLLLEYIKQLQQENSKLTEFENWLEEQNPTNSNENFIGIRLADIKNKLQELKGSNK